MTLQDRPGAESGENKESTITKDRQTILLLDSDQELRKNIRYMGRRHKFAVFSAMTYAQAIRMLVMRQNINVAVVGIYAERFKETRDALAQLKKERPDLCVIALADVRDSNIALDLVQEERIFRYMIKPVKEAELVRNIRAGFNHSDMLKKVQGLKAMHALPDETDELSRLEASIRNRV